MVHPQNRENPENPYNYREILVVEAVFAPLPCPFPAAEALVDESNELGVSLELVRATTSKALAATEPARPWWRS